MKLAKLAEQLAEWTQTEVLLDETFCLHGRDRYATCTACSDICPVEAIEPLAPPVLTQALCRDCRACLAVCPTGACLYTGRDAVDSLHSCVQAAGLRRFELLCAHNPEEAVGQRELGVRVRGCLAGLGVAAYLGLFAAGAEAVDVRLDACKACAWAGLAVETERQVTGARRLLGLWGAEGRLMPITNGAEAASRARPLWQAESPPRSRRQLLAAMAGEDTALKQAGDGQRFYRDRLRFVRAVRALPPASEAEACAASLAGLGFAALAVDAGCTACRACARACPTEALTYTAEEDRFTLSFEPQLCVGCEACTHVCAPQAIVLDHEPTFHDVFGSDEPRVLAEGPLTHCKRCGAAFAARLEQALCPVCDFREKNPFGSFIPPGAKLRRPRPGAQTGGRDGKQVLHDN